MAVGCGVHGGVILAARSIGKMLSLTQRFLPLLLLFTHWDLWPWFIRRGAENQDAALLHGVLAVGIAGWWLPRRNPDFTHGFYQKLTLMGVICCGIAGVLDTYPLIRMLLLSVTLAGSLLMQLPNTHRNAAALSAACLLLPFSEETSAFFLGYPARVLAGSVTGFFLRLGGDSVIREGAVLSINGKALFADAPCSGLVMGWTSFAIAGLIALYHHLNARRTLKLYIVTAILILMGNSFRMLMLAQLNEWLVSGTESRFLHNAIGIFSFIVLIPVLMWAGRPQPPPRSPENGSSWNTWWPLLLIGAATAPLLATSQHSSDAAAPLSVDWPETWEGNTLVRLPPNELDKQFMKNFPGVQARFQAGEQELLFRQLTRPSRQLHASLQCYRATGYKVTPLPAIRDNRDALWSQYHARKGIREVVVSEQIRSLSSGRTWPDVSAWYWDAVTGRDPGPWRAVTVARPVSL